MPARELTFICNGEDVLVAVQPGMPLWAARNTALESSGNTGRPADDWLIYDPIGTLVDPRVLVSDAYRFVLSLKVGCGGLI